MRSARILVPPGIGDGYWVLVKLRGYLAKYRITNPIVWVQNSDPQRSHGMWQRVPFVRFGGYADVPRPGAIAQDKKSLRRAYREAGYAAQQVVCGFDHFLSFNGTLGAGQSLDEALPGPSNWYEPMFDAAVTAAHASAFRERFGPYIATAFWSHASYGRWIADFPEADIVRTLGILADAGKTVVIMGAAWDRGGIADRIAAADPRFVPLVGETDFDQLTGLLSGADGVFGFPAGNTLLGPYFRRPTVLIWNTYYARPMWKHSVPPDAAYLAIDSAGADPGSVAAHVLTLIGESKATA